MSNEPITENDALELAAKMWGRDKCGHELKPLTGEQVWALMANLNPARISQRRQGNSGPQLSYLEGWDVKAALTRVFGLGGWSSEVVEYRTEDAREMTGNSGKKNWHITVSARVQIHIHQLGAWYTEVAYSSQANPSWGDAAEFASKTAETDALKRAAISLGTQFGLSLYNSGTTVDVVKTLMDPDQRAARDAFLAELAGKSAAIDDTPPNPVVPEQQWSGDDDQSQGGALPAEETQTPKSRDYLKEAQNAATASAVRAVWNAAHADSAGAALENKIAAIGKALAEREAAAKGTDPAQRAASKSRLQESLKQDGPEGA